MLFFLGIDSAFSFVEGFLTVLGDTKLFQNVDKKITTFVVTLVAWLLGLLYATDGETSFQRTQREFLFVSVISPNICVYGMFQLV